MPFHSLNTSLIELIEKRDTVICCSSDGVNSCAGLKYELVGDYYLIAGDDEPEEDQPIGVWGQRHLRYLKEHRRVRYANLLTSGELSAYLADIDRQAEEIFFWLVKEKADAEGITETLKASDQMKWVGRMNSCRDRASARPVDPIRPVHLYTYCFLRKSGFSHKLYR